MKTLRTAQWIKVMLVLAWTLPAFGQNFPKPPDANLGPVFDPTSNITKRVNVVHQLSHDLPSDSIKLLCQFLTASPGKKETNIPGLHFLKNEIWALLRNQNVPPANFTRMTIAISEDPGQDLVTRDYAIQHLATWYEQGAADAPDARNLIQTALIKMTRQDSTLAVTALLALQHISELPLEGPMRQDASFRSIGDAAVRIATSKKSSEAMRITAFQICALRGRKEILPVVESIAQDRARPGLQISAIAALGRLGGPKDTVLLRQLDADKEIQVAVSAALKQLSRNLASRDALGTWTP